MIIYLPIEVEVTREKEKLACHIPMFDLYYSADGDETINNKGLAMVGVRITQLRNPEIEYDISNKPDWATWEQVQEIAKGMKVKV